MAKTNSTETGFRAPPSCDEAPYMVNIFRVDDRDSSADIEAAVAQTIAHQAEAALSETPVIDVSAPDLHASQGQARSRTRLMAVILLFGMGAALLMLTLQGRETMADRIEDIVPLPATIGSPVSPDVRSSPAQPELASLPAQRGIEVVVGGQGIVGNPPL